MKYFTAHSTEGIAHTRRSMYDVDVIIAEYPAEHIAHTSDGVIEYGSRKELEAAAKEAERRGDEVRRYYR